MGRTIDEHIAQLKKLKSFHNGSYGASINFALDTMRKYQILQADYENRLKADMVAMLDKIRAEIEKQYKWLLSAEVTTYNIDIAFDAIRKAVESEKE